MHLVAPTQSYRATLTQEARAIVRKTNVPGVRRVQLLIPGSPEALMGIDTDLEDLGLNRSYKLAEWPTGAPITVHLKPDQWIVGASRIGLAHVSVIVEYLVDP